MVLFRSRMMLFNMKYTNISTYGYCTCMYVELEEQSTHSTVEELVQEAGDVLCVWDQQNGETEYKVTIP